VLLDGFWWSHVLWILSRRHEATETKRVRDLSRYPELVWLDRWWYAPPVALGLAMFFAGGWFALVWGFLVPTVSVWHATFTVNSITHMVGSRRYETPDNSRNNALIAALTLGEGWHNNHHHYPRSTRLGFFWWEIDVPYYVLRGMAALGLVWDLREPPPHVLRSAVRARTSPA
jgi:stearoyl-CoA desaturase (delta-9 desaturase)